MNFIRFAVCLAGVILLLAAGHCAESGDSASKESSVSYTNPVYVIQHNHFDPTWRRCWDRTFDFRGKRYRSYADVQEKIIGRWMENARRGATWSEGQAVVFRKYLERNPDALAEIQDLVSKGVIEVTAAGETVSDTNMPSGETLLRNLIMGQRYFEETFGVIPGIGWLEDAFGQSAQIPQLFRGIECDSVWRLCYTRVPGQYWKGLDGSVIAIIDQKDHFIGSFHKIPPCPDCSGVGCMKCDMTGLDPNAALIENHMIQPALAMDYKHDPYTLLFITGEEVIPNLNLPDFFEQAGKDRGIDFRWGTYRDIAKNHYVDVLAGVDDPDVETSDEVEGNPALTGCYVSRIKIKQGLRRVENLVNTAERWATVAYLLGEDYPEDLLTSAWRDTVFIGFHDAVTGTHIDQAYFELLDMLDDAEYTANTILDGALQSIAARMEHSSHGHSITIFNSESWERRDPVTIKVLGSRGRPTLRDLSGGELDVLDVRAEGTDVYVTFAPPPTAPLGYTLVDVEPDTAPIDSGEIVTGPGEVENDFFKIRVFAKGIDSITDKRTGGEILSTDKYLANELILEEDIGNPWSTQQQPSFRTGLSQYTTGVKVRKGRNVSEIEITGQYKGDDANVKVLTWRQTATIYKGVDRIDFRTEIDWDTSQRRIMVAFPTDIRKDEMMYSIPYGAVSRSKYDGEWRHVPGKNGDWPAVNWVDLHSEEDNRGVALLNTGTPSHKVENGVILMSILRSPTDSWYLNEPHYYDCPDFDGARDAGRHEFFYSLIPHQGDYRAAGIEKRGRELNNPLIAMEIESSGAGRLPRDHSFLKMASTDNVIVTAVKKAERDGSVVVRLAETAGASGDVTLSIEKAGVRKTLVNFLERQPETVRGKIRVSPFKILTLKLSK